MGDLRTLADRPSNLPGPEAGEPSSQQTASNRSDLLESWKEIASYLKRDVRTVQRWEKREGLPVHRHQHDERASVFAYKSELDAWWRDGHSQLEEGKGKSPEEESSGSVYVAGNGHASVVKGTGSRASVRRHWRLWLAGAAVAAAVSAAIAIYLLRPQPTPPLNFHSRDLVLISSFENRTGESVFNGTLEAALERDLTNSRFVSVVPRVRINDTLALMRKPASTRVGATLGREICLRDGGIRALIAGRVEKLGTTYVLSADLVDPTNGRTVASFEDRANSQNDVLAAVHRLGNRLRQTLGEKLSQIRQSDLALQKVTTPSLKALQLYSQADQVVATDLEGNRVAFELLKQAIAEDPNFASAYLLAAYALFNQGKPSREYMPYLKRALSLSGQTSEPERYFIEASYYDISYHMSYHSRPSRDSAASQALADRAIATYHALLRIDPTHFWATNNLFNLYRWDPEKEQESVDLAVRLAKLCPNSFARNWRAGYWAAVFGGNPALASPYFDRAKKLYSAMSDSDRDRPGFAEAALWLQLYPAYQAWMKNDAALAIRELAKAEKDPVTRNGTAYPDSIGQFYLSLGQVRKASEWLQRSPDAWDRAINRTYLAFFRDDHAALRSSLRRLARRPKDVWGFALLMARGGLYSEADSVVQKFSRLSKRYPGPPPDYESMHEISRGGLLVAEGKMAAGIPSLRDGMQLMQGNTGDVYFLGAESLAQAYEKEGNMTAALQVLEDASANRSLADINYGDGGAMYAAPYWMHDQMDLARLYRRMGRVKDAQKIEAEMRKLLAYADPDFPMLVELKQLQKADAMTPKQD